MDVLFVFGASPENSCAVRGDGPILREEKAHLFSNGKFQRKAGNT